MICLKGWQEFTKTDISHEFVSNLFVILCIAVSIANQCFQNCPLINLRNRIYQIDTNLEINASKSELRLMESSD